MSAFDESSPDKNASSNSGRMAAEDSDMPVIRKKEHDYLGMFEYKKEQEQQVLKALIYG